MDLDDIRRRGDQEIATSHPELSPEQLKTLQDASWAAAMAAIGEPPAGAQRLASSRRS
jgi:hypothetical protein